MVPDAITLRDLTPDTLKSFKRLHQVLFPVAFTDAYYKESLKIGSLAKLAFHNDTCVGVLRCAYDESSSTLYILAIGVLAPYRHLGIGSRLYNYLILQARERGAAKVELHVQTSNENAIEWYKARGFQIIEKVDGYYKRALDKDAYLLRSVIE